VQIVFGPKKKTASTDPCTKKKKKKKKKKTGKDPIDTVSARLENLATDAGWLAMWERAKAHPVGRQEFARDPDVRTAVLRAVRLGSYARATRLLEKRAEVAIDPVTAAEGLAQLHPRREEDWPGVYASAEHLPPCTIAAVTADEIAAAIRSFDPLTAAGPSGLKASHLQACVGLGGTHAARLLEALQRWVFDNATASLPSQHYPLLGSAHLVAIGKPAGGVRPIAVGETLRCGGWCPRCWRGRRWRRCGRAFSRSSEAWACRTGRRTPRWRRWSA
jgi:hypothetical protein